MTYPRFNYILSFIVSICICIQFLGASRITFYPGYNCNPLAPGTCSCSTRDGIFLGVAGYCSSTQDNCRVCTTSFPGVDFSRGYSSKCRLPAVVRQFPNNGCSIGVGHEGTGIGESISITCSSNIGSTANWNIRGWGDVNSCDPNTPINSQYGPGYDIYGTGNTCINFVHGMSIIVDCSSSQIDLPLSINYNQAAPIQNYVNNPPDRSTWIPMNRAPSSIDSTSNAVTISGENSNDDSSKWYDPLLKPGIIAASTDLALIGFGISTGVIVTPILAAGLGVAAVWAAADIGITAISGAISNVFADITTIAGGSSSSSNRRLLALGDQYNISAIVVSRKSIPYVYANLTRSLPPNPPSFTTSSLYFTILGHSSLSNSNINQPLFTIQFDVTLNDTTVQDLINQGYNSLNSFSFPYTINTTLSTYAQKQGESSYANPKSSFNLLISILLVTFAILLVITN